MEGRGRISRSGLTQNITVGSCIFHCNVPHQWITQRQVGPVSVYCDGVVCHVLCLRHGIPVWQHIGQSTTATSRHLRNMFQSDVKLKTKQKNDTTASIRSPFAMFRSFIVNCKLFATVSNKVYLDQISRQWWASLFNLQGPGWCWNGLVVSGLPLMR